jgi:hypothetical protein
VKQIAYRLRLESAGRAVRVQISINFFYFFFNYRIIFVQLKKLNCYKYFSCLGINTQIILMVAPQLSVMFKEEQTTKLWHYIWWGFAHHNYEASSASWSLVQIYLFCLVEKFTHSGSRCSRSIVNMWHCKNDSLLF